MLCALSLPFRFHLLANLAMIYCHSGKKNIFTSTKSWHECSDTFYGNCAVWLNDGVLSACAMRSKDDKMLVNAELGINWKRLEAQLNVTHAIINNYGVFHYFIIIVVDVISLAHHRH